MEIPKEAMEALSEAARDKLPVADLEFLGASSRALSLLDDAGIVSMDQLLAKDREQLSEIPSLGKKSIDGIIGTLCIYHKLDELRAATQANLQQLYKSCGISAEIAANFTKEPEE